MKFTLKQLSKQIFNRWYEKQPIRKDLHPSDFHSAPFLMKVGVYESFLNKHGIHPRIEDCELNDINSSDRYHSVVMTKDKWFARGFYPTKEKAQIDAYKASFDKIIESYSNLIAEA